MPQLPAKKAAAKRPARSADAESEGGEERKTAPAAAKPTGASFIDFEDVEDKLNVMYYGAGGTGKTLASAGMANLGRVMYLNAESGLKRRPIADRGIDASNLKVWQPTDEEGEPCLISYDALDRLYWQLKSDLDDDPTSWVGVVWDSVTEIHKAVLENVVQIAVAKSERKGVERDPFFTDRADYGVMTEQMRQLIRRFRDLPCHLAITALERRDVDSETGHVERGPAVTPALQNDLYGYLDMVLHTDTVEVGGKIDYRGLSKPIGTYQAKDRFGALPRYTIDVAFDRLVGFVRGDLTTKTDPVTLEAKRRHAESKQAEIDQAADTAN